MPATPCNPLLRLQLTSKAAPGAVPQPGYLVKLCASLSRPSSSLAISQSVWFQLNAPAEAAEAGLVQASKVVIGIALSMGSGDFAGSDPSSLTGSQKQGTKKPQINEIKTSQLGMLHPWPFLSCIYLADGCRHLYHVLLLKQNEGSRNPF